MALTLTLTVASLRARILAVLQAAPTDIGSETLADQVGHWGEILALEPPLDGDTVTSSIVVSEAEEDVQQIDGEPGIAKVLTRFTVRICAQVATNDALTTEQNWLAAKTEAWRLHDCAQVALWNNRGLVRTGTDDRAVQRIASQRIASASYLPTVAGSAVYYSLEWSIITEHAQRAYRMV